MTQQKEQNNYPATDTKEMEDLPITCKRIKNDGFKEVQEFSSEQK